METQYLLLHRHFGQFILYELRMLLSLCVCHTNIQYTQHAETNRQWKERKKENRVSEIQRKRERD